MRLTRGSGVRPSFLFALIVVFFLPVAPAAAAGAVVTAGLARLLLAARRARVSVGQGGLAVESLFGLAARWVPVSEIGSLAVEGRELVARDGQRRVLFRSLQSEQERWAETFATIEGVRSGFDDAPTGFERAGRGLAAWLAAIDAKVAEPASSAYRDEAFAWERTLDVFRSSAKSEEARAGAAWALLGSNDPAHAKAVLDAASPELPPLVLAVCALHPRGSAITPLARPKLRYLSRSDRLEWKARR